MGLFGRFFGGAEGRSDQARRNQQDAGDRFAQSINKDGAQRDPESISAANDLAARAKRLVAEIRFEEAEPLLRQSLAIFEGAYGPNHPRVAEALCDLAKVLQDCDEAEALYRRSLAIAEGAFGPDHPNVVIPLHGMAVSLEVLSFRYQEAEALYRRCLAISEAACGPDDPKVAQIMERIAATLERQSRYEEAESLYRRSLAIMEGALGPDHPNVARTRKELATLSNKSHGTGLLRREGGKKYLRIDGAHAVVHACSTVEGYLERYANDGIGNIELKWFVDGAIESSRPGPAEQQECCYCGTLFEIEPRFPNTSVDVECPHCGRGQAFYVIQMTAGLEQDLGMENRLGNGYATIWLTVPLQHPEFSTLLTKHGVVTWKSPHRSDLPDEMVEQDLSAAGLQYTDTWQGILWFDRFKDQEEMQWYRETLSGVETLVLLSTERGANEPAKYEVSSPESQENLDVESRCIAGGEMVPELTDTWRGWTRESLLRALVDALGDSDEDVCSNAAAALGAIGDPSAVPALIDALGDDEMHVRRSAAEALGAIGDPSAVPALMDTLRRADVFTRADAAKALGVLGVPYQVTGKIKAQRDAEEGVRLTQAETVARVSDPSAVPALKDLLRDDSDRVVRGPDASVRSAAAEALGKLGDPSAVRALIQALRDADGSVRSSAAIALGKLGDPSALPALIDALRDADKGVRASAAWTALADLGDPSAVPALIEALGDADDVVRASAAAALGKLGNPSAVPALIDALRDTDEGVRSSTALALGKLGNPSAVPALIDALGDADAEVRSQATRALGKLGDPCVTPVLIDALSDARRQTRWSAAVALGLLGDPSAVPALIDALSDADEDVRASVAEALGRVGDPLAAPALIDALESGYAFAAYPLLLIQGAGSPSR